MKNKIVLLITIISVILLTPNCSKDDLVLDQDYVTVSDLKHYCHCDRNTSIFFDTDVKTIIEQCNNKEVKVKGHIDNEFHKLFLNYGYKLNSFYLRDIRNRNSICICLNDDFICSYIDTIVTSQDSAIINKILNSNETDMCYIKGILHSYELPMNTSSKIEINILINNADDIFFKSDINY
ncbi:MAG: hypothetical protein QMD02_07335 [Bacteroidales bacterium]|nr:hypothetical protein [Bacteroidales bacterium]